MIARSAGLYARFFAPTDLRASIGSHYLVRTLENRRGDHARLAAATMGMALSIAFDAMRKGMTVDLDELLRKVRSGGIKELTLKDVTLPDGTRIAQTQLDNAADAVMFGDLMERSRQVEPAEVTSARVAKHRQQLRGASQSIAGRDPTGLMLSKAMADHLRYLQLKDWRLGDWAVLSKITLVQGVLAFTLLFAFAISWHLIRLRIRVQSYEQLLA
jgi:hypothetical protein